MEYKKRGEEILKDTLILGIETSCDETAAAVVRNGREVLSNVINSQINIHEKYGGVVPEIASRKHIQAISYVVKEALDEAKVKFEDIDAIGCTYGPRTCTVHFLLGQVMQKL